MDNLYSQLQTIVDKGTINNEAVYFGKTKGVLELEKACGALIEAAKEDLLGVQNFTNGKLSKVTADLEQVIERFTNAGDCYINYDSGSFSTYARLLVLPNYDIKDLQGGYEIDKTGVRFKNGKNKKILLNISLAYCISLTAGELTAILLHEIGHNMNVQSKSVVLLGLSLYTNPIGLLYALISVNFENFVLTEVNKTDMELFKSTIKFITNLKGTVSSIINMANQIIDKFIPIGAFTTVGNILYRFARYNNDPTNPKIPNPAKMLFERFIGAILGYDGEVYADAFASSYGYAPELASALEKITMQKVTKTLNKNFIGYRYFSVLNDFVSEILMYGLAPHPHRVNRIAGLADYLNDTAKYTTNPKLKEEIKHQSKELKELLTAIATDDDEALIDQLQAKNVIAGKEVKSRDYRQLFTQYRNWEKSNLAASGLLKETLDEITEEVIVVQESIYTKISKML